MTNSMTAFANSEMDFENLTINCELRSVNHRYCDISLKNLQDKRGLEFVKNRLTELLSLLEVKTVEEAKNQIIDIMKKIKIETSLTKLGIKKSDLETIINNGFNPLRVKNNPRLLTKMELRNILEKIL